MRNSKIIVLLFLVSLLAACAPMKPAPTVSSVPESPRDSGLPPPDEPQTRPQPPPVQEPAPEPPSSAVTALLSQGWGQYRRNDYQGALSTAERAQRIDPRSPEVYLLMANAQFSLYQIAVAEQVARRGLAMAASGTAVSAQLQALLAKIAAAK